MFLGLCCRINNPLDFLGLYKTLNNDDASRRRHIPAKVIAGSSNEEQLIVAAKRYFDRPYVMVDLLQDFSRQANIEYRIPIVQFWGNNRSYYTRRTGYIIKSVILIDKIYPYFTGLLTMGQLKV